MIVRFLADVRQCKLEINNVYGWGIKEFPIYTLIKVLLFIYLFLWKWVDNEHCPKMEAGSANMWNEEKGQ